MIQLLTKKIKNRKGFTLIELIVVISVLGILSAIAVPRFSTVTADAQATADKATARTILSAVTMAEAKYATNDPSVNNINEFLNEPIVLGDATSAVKWGVKKDTNGKWVVTKWNGTTAEIINPSN